jgi:hypothetical protein
MASLAFTKLLSLGLLLLLRSLSLLSSRLKVKGQENLRKMEEEKK